VADGGFEVLLASLFRSLELLFLGFLERRFLAVVGAGQGGQLLPVLFVGGLELRLAVGDCGRNVLLAAFLRGGQGGGFVCGCRFQRLGFLGFLLLRVTVVRLLQRGQLAVVLVAKRLHGAVVLGPRLLELGRRLGVGGCECAVVLISQSGERHGVLVAE
jgi:hypothetical protein